MARVILEVPSDKMQPFLQAILSLGLERHAISSGKPEGRSRRIRRNNRLRTHKMPSNILLFDWEFFSNELEYE